MPNENLISRFLAVVKAKLLVLRSLLHMDGKLQSSFTIDLNDDQSFSTMRALAVRGWYHLQFHTVCNEEILATTGARALLWHQGESDTINATSADS